MSLVLLMDLRTCEIRYRWLYSRYHHVKPALLSASTTAEQRRDVSKHVCDTALNGFIESCITIVNKQPPPALLLPSGRVSCRLSRVPGWLCSSANLGEIWLDTFHEKVKRAVMCFVLMRMPEARKRLAAAQCEGQHSETAGELIGHAWVEEIWLGRISRNCRAETERESVPSFFMFDNLIVNSGKHDMPRKAETVRSKIIFYTLICKASLPCTETLSGKPII